MKIHLNDLNVGDLFCFIDKEDDIFRVTANHKKNYLFYEDKIPKIGLLGMTNLSFIHRESYKNPYCNLIIDEC